MTRRTLLATLSCAAAEAPAPLWDPAVLLPKASAIAPLRGVRFSVIKAHEPERDGYGFLHGVGLAWHKGKLYASFGHNKAVENTVGEQARGRVSTDGGRTWGDVFTIDAGDPGQGLAVSHGSFLSHRGRLWAFMGAFHGARERVHTRAYVLNERTGAWMPRGVVVRDGFWPMHFPVRMPNGNWIMAGFQVGGGEPASVAVSHGRDFTRWDHVVIPRDPGLKKMWGESAVIVSGGEVLNIGRYGGEAMALVSRSQDGGRTWTTMRPSNLAMATSKPCAGVLSTGQRYLICTTAADTGARRAPLTIAVSRRGQAHFSRVYLIRNAEFPEGPGDSHPRANLAYPYAVEHQDHLYAGYSNNGGRKGMNINSAELAVIPVAALHA
ncbi:MAG: exo-alpha-sialidase [Acidobacteria bacterium]|nr:exo-alpha-sialidase [Acidobacteriota bacterium]